MNQVFAGGLALLIALILWSSKKQSKSSPFSQSKKDFLSKNTKLTSLVFDKSLQKQKTPRLNHKKSEPCSNKSLFHSKGIKKELTKLMSSNPDDRLLAIAIATQWKNKTAIPFLRRGLKDSDSRVMIASAAAIASFKGKTIDLQKKPQASRPPRNVSLMR
tara:strand:- start:606 stop:1085 length:480 start_codon:yes stop_codon:yes gene_type:complete